MKPFIVTSGRLVNLLVVYMYWGGNTIIEMEHSKDAYTTIEEIVRRLVSLNVHTPAQLRSIGGAAGQAQRNFIASKSTQIYSRTCVRKPSSPLFLIEMTKRGYGVGGGPKRHYNTPKDFVTKPILLERAGIEMAKRLEVLPTYPELKEEYVRVYN